MPYAYLHAYEKDEIATRAGQKLQPLFGELKSQFVAASTQQQEQLNRMEEQQRQILAQQAEILSLLKPKVLGKSAMQPKSGDRAP